MMVGPLIFDTPERWPHDGILLVLFNDYGYLRHDVQRGIDCGQRQLLQGIRYRITGRNRATVSY